MKAPRTLATGLLPACLAFGLHASPAAAETPAGAPEAAPADPAATLPAPSAPAEYNLPPPSARWQLALTGVAVTGVSYGLALGASYAWPDARTSNELRIPVVGPWMAIADTGCEPEEPDCSTVLLVVAAIFTGLDGVVQAGGVGMAIESLFLPTSSGKPRKDASPSVRPVPYVVGTDAVGLGLVGSF